MSKIEIKDPMWTTISMAKGLTLKQVKCLAGDIEAFLLSKSITCKISIKEE